MERPPKDKTHAMETDLPAREAVAGLILMGGRGSRLGGVDKALIDLGGRTVLAYALERFLRQVGRLALSANGDPARLEGFGLPVLPDADDGLGGPLAGVRAGLAWAAGLPGVTHLATVPGDAPSPAEDLVARLLAAGRGRLACAATPGGIEPLHALWPLALAPELESLIAEGTTSPRRALARLGAAEARFASSESFRDIDTPADLAAAKTNFRDA